MTHTQCVTVFTNMKAGKLFTLLFLLDVHFVSVYGRDVKALVEQPLEEEPMHPGKNTVTYESRVLKALLLQLMS